MSQLYLVDSQKPEEIPDNAEYICLDICRERVIKRLVNSADINGRVKKPPVQNELNTDFSLTNIESIYYKLWIRSQINSNGKDEYTEIMKKCHEKDIRYIPVSMSESDLVIKSIHKHTDIKDLIKAITMSLTSKDITKTENMVNIEKKDDCAQRQILKNIKSLLNEKQTLYLFANSSRLNPLAEKLDFESPSIETTIIE